MVSLEHTGSFTEDSPDTLILYTGAQKACQVLSRLELAGFPSVKGEKPACASQGAEPGFAHGKEIEEFGQLFPAERQEHLRTHIGVVCAQNDSERHKYLRLSKCFISLA